MERKTALKIVDIQEEAMKDGQYIQLLEEYKGKHEAFLRLLYEMEKNERDVILDYLGVCVQMHLRLLELAADYSKMG